MRVFLIGFMGSGKTHWGTQLAAQLKIPFFDLDEQIELKEGKSVTDIFASAGEEHFRTKERETLEALIDTHPSMVLSTGGGTPCFFNNIKTMRKYGVAVWLNTHVEVLLQRLLKGKSSRPLIKNIPDDELRTYIVRKLNERKIYYEQANITVDNENSISINEFLQMILHA